MRTLEVMGVVALAFLIFITGIYVGNTDAQIRVKRECRDFQLTIVSMAKVACAVEKEYK